MRIYLYTVISILLFNVKTERNSNVLLHGNILERGIFSTYIICLKLHQMSYIKLEKQLTHLEIHIL